MKKFACRQCDYIYDPVEETFDEQFDSCVPHGMAPDEVFFDRDAPMDPPGVSFSDLPGSWVCPQCGCAKEDFTP